MSEIIYYNYYTTNGNETLQTIARNSDCNVGGILKINPYDSSSPQSIQNLASALMNNEKLPAGMTIKVPTSTPSAKSVSYATTDPFSRIRYGWDSRLADGSSGYRGYDDPFCDGFSRTKCMVYVYHGSNQTGLASIPYPMNISDSPSPSFNGTSIFGRSVDFQTYQGSSRSVSFDLDFHEDIYPDPAKMHETINLIQSACYPKYEGDKVFPPRVYFAFSTHFSVEGILTNASASWDGPVMNSDKDPFGHLVHCKLSISVQETSGPYSAEDIYPGSFGRRSGWRGNKR